MDTINSVKNIGLHYGTYRDAAGIMTECMVAVGVLKKNTNGNVDGIDIKFHRRIKKDERLLNPKGSIPKVWYYKLYPDLMKEGELIVINLIKEVDSKNEATIIVQNSDGSKVMGTDKGFGFNVCGDELHAKILNSFCGRNAFLHMNNIKKEIKPQKRVYTHKVPIKTYSTTRFKVRDCRTAK